MRNAPVCCIIKSCTCCKTHMCMHQVYQAQFTSPDIDLNYIVLLFTLMLSEDSMDFLSVAGAAACFQQSKPSSVVHLSFTDEEILNQSVIKCVVWWRASLTHRFCRPDGISATRRGGCVSGNTEVKMPRGAF